VITCGWKQLLAGGPFLHVESLRHTHKYTLGALLYGPVAFARYVFDETHITGPQMRLGPVAGFDVDLTIHGDGELPVARIVQLFAASRRRVAGIIHDGARNQHAAFRCNIDLLQVRVPAGVAPHTIQARTIRPFMLTGQNSGCAHQRGQPEHGPLHCGRHRSMKPYFVKVRNGIRSLDDT